MSLTVIIVYTRDGAAANYTPAPRIMSATFKVFQKRPETCRKGKNSRNLPIWFLKGYSVQCSRVCANQHGLDRDVMNTLFVDGCTVATTTWWFNLSGIQSWWCIRSAPVWLLNSFLEKSTLSISNHSRRTSRTWCRRQDTSISRQPNPTLLVSGKKTTCVYPNQTPESGFSRSSLNHCNWILVTASQLEKFSRDSEHRNTAIVACVWSAFLSDFGNDHFFLLLGIGLNDSPIGLAGYILEKFSTWTNRTYVDLPDGGLTRFVPDIILLKIFCKMENKRDPRNGSCV